MPAATEAPKGLQEVKSHAALLIKERQEHLAAAQKIEQDLLGLRDQLDGILKGVTVPVRSTPAKRPGRPVGSRNRAQKAAKTTTKARSGRSRGRNGGESGTQKIEAILAQATGKRMESGALAREAEKQGVPNPHSSYQSLKRRNRIELKDGFVTLVG